MLKATLELHYSNRTESLDSRFRIARLSVRKRPDPLSGSALWTFAPSYVMSRATMLYLALLGRG